MPGGDSIKLIQDDQYVRRIHSEILGSGKLQRGSSTRLRNASIPSKFQTFVVPNTDNKGFNAQAKRFQHSMSEVPGPGAYSLSSETVLLQTKTSLSKAGFGSLTSKAVRFPQKFSVDKTPAPNVYETSGNIADRKDFSHAVASHQFHMPIAVGPKIHSLLSREAIKMPAPNQYEVTRADQMMFKQSGGATTQFKSTAQRTGLDNPELKLHPGPAQYEVKDDLLKPDIVTSGATHCFVSNSERLQIYDKKYKSPGPAAYDIRASGEKALKQSSGSQFPRKHFLCLSAPAIPPAAPGPTPGPGQYEMGTYKEPIRIPMSSSAFVSNTSRWQIGSLDDYALPSPAQYNPQKLSKQSFIFNGKNNWVC